MKQIGAERTRTVGGAGRTGFLKLEPLPKTQAGGMGTKEEIMYGKYGEVLGLSGDLEEKRGMVAVMRRIANLRTLNRAAKRKKKELLDSIASCEKAAERCRERMQSHFDIGLCFWEISERREMSAREIEGEIGKLDETIRALRETIKMHDEVLGTGE